MHDGEPNDGGILDEDILNLLKQEALLGRQHSSDLSWHDRSPFGKGLVEHGWSEALFHELRVDGQCPYSELAKGEDQWPDCEAKITATGERVAIEVSEVVRGASLAPGGRPEPWTREEFLETIQHRLSEKDSKGFHGGKYSQHLVILHSDELYITEEWVKVALEGAAFALPHKTIDIAYLILGYRGGRRAYYRLAFAT